MMERKIRLLQTSTTLQLWVQSEDLRQKIDASPGCSTINGVLSEFPSRCRISMLKTTDE